MTHYKKLIFLLLSCLAFYKFISPVAAIEAAQKILNRFGS